MQYKIFCDDYCLYDSQLDDFQVGHPTLKQEVNCVDELKFTIYPSHPYFNNISKLSSIVTVYRDDNLIFKGRVISSNQGFHNEKEITCEGVLAFLLDTIIRPFDFPNDDQFSDLDYSTDNVIEYFLNWVIDCHNSQVDLFHLTSDTEISPAKTYYMKINNIYRKVKSPVIEGIGSYYEITKSFKHISLGNVVATDPNNYLARSSIEFLSSKEIIYSRILDTYGGYFIVKDENGVNILDYIEDFTSDGTESGDKLVCTQKIEFGSNLIELTQVVDGADIKTGIIPLGARIEDSEGHQTDKCLTIESLPDGVLSEGIIKTGDHILNTTLSENYGAIYEVIKWEDVNTTENLQNKALAYLADSVKFKNALTIKDIDLKLTDDQI